MEIEKSLPENQTCKVACSSCNRETIHQILTQASAEHDIDILGYWSKYYWQIIQCRGCETVSFLEDYIDNEDESFGEKEGNSIPNHHIKLYPPRILGKQKLEKILGVVPSKVIQIYRETFLAICNKQNILAGIGIRSIIEIVCKDFEADGNDLYKKIEDLKTKSVISEVERTFLHNSRLFGNFAAHEVIALSETVLYTLFDIVNHILNALYILPKRNEELNKELERKKNKNK